MDRQKTIIGITCSTFDLLHAGHIIMLEECKKYCDYLICALQVDPSTDRPDKNKQTSVSQSYIKIILILFWPVILKY